MGERGRVSEVFHGDPVKGLQGVREKIVVGVDSRTRAGDRDSSDVQTLPPPLSFSTPRVRPTDRRPQIDRAPEPL